MRVTCVGIACVLLVGCYGVDGGGGGYSVEDLCDDARDCAGDMSEEDYATCLDVWRQNELNAQKRCCEEEFARLMSCIGRNAVCEDGQFDYQHSEYNCAEEESLLKNCDRCGTDGEEEACVPNSMISCTCPDGLYGYRVCLDGQSFSDCQCGLDAGMDGRAGVGGSGMGGSGTGGAGTGGLSCGMAGSINPCPCPGDPPGSVSGTQICRADGTYTPCACGTAGFCGDGVVNVDAEQCDGTDLGGMTCGLLGMGTGVLACYAANCVFDTSMCHEEPPAAGAGGSGGSGTLYCCALDLLCTQSPTLEMAPCLRDPTFLNAARKGDESECKRVIDNNDMRVHKYDCSQPGHSQDCWFEEADALAACS
jgi:hypothetical protein